MKKEIEEFAIKIIKSHGFRSNTISGFSCIITDKYNINPSRMTEGLVLWVFSRNHHRFETQFQHFKTANRIKRMEEMLKLESKKYKIKIEKAIYKYAESLRKINGFHKIGSGVKFWESKIFNLACDFSYLNDNFDSLLEIEEFTVNNPIVKFAEDKGYFQCLNKDKLVWDEFFGK